MTDKNIIIENAVIRYRNFSGKAGEFNAEGQRNFSVVLEVEDAKNLAEDGWPVRWLEPKDPGDNALPILKVHVKFSPIVPKIVLISSKGKTNLDEESIGILDWADIDIVDLTIRPYNWVFNRKSGVKAFVKTMYVTIKEDEFEKKYRDVPDTAVNSFFEDDEG